MLRWRRGQISHVGQNSTDHFIFVTLVNCTDINDSLTISRHEPYIILRHFLKQSFLLNFHFDNSDVSLLDQNCLSLGRRPECSHQRRSDSDGDSGERCHEIFHAVTGRLRAIHPCFFQTLKVW